MITLTQSNSPTVTCPIGFYTDENGNVIAVRPPGACFIQATEFSKYPGDRCNTGAKLEYDNYEIQVWNSYNKNSVFFLLRKKINEPKYEWWCINYLPEWESVFESPEDTWGSICYHFDRNKYILNQIEKRLSNQSLFNPDTLPTPEVWKYEPDYCYSQ